MHDTLFDRSEAATFLKFKSIRSLDYLVRTNQIPYSRVGKRKILFSRDRLLQYLADQENVQYRLPREGGGCADS